MEVSTIAIFQDGTRSLMRGEFRFGVVVVHSEHTLNWGDTA